MKAAFARFAVAVFLGTAFACVPVLSAQDGLRGVFGDLAVVRNSETRSISAENPTGAKGGGATAVPDEKNPASKLGVGWKVRPAITLPIKQVTILASVEGPGRIQHIWITADPSPIATASFVFIGMEN
jgi:hypothetical protein